MEYKKVGGKYFKDLLQVKYSGNQLGPWYWAWFYASVNKMLLIGVYSLQVSQTVNRNKIVQKCLHVISSQLAMTPWRFWFCRIISLWRKR